jgi:hypothetical protein
MNIRLAGFLRLARAGPRFGIKELCDEFGGILLVDYTCFI